ncbi:hypothetical protein DBV15_06183 [Temnothorax longispinosus]|uniref:Uncharacterized protein n=1 Tax=Temnothorax longispinosus TaxID=300112 RepID=A0A4V3S7D1_9HYME|nr:hypothetical protein DBV15_06183 [Temnothorax longispinosus]
MKTLTICLLMFCIVAVSSKPWICGYHPLSRGYIRCIHSNQPRWDRIDITNDSQGEVKKEAEEEVKDYIMPPEIELTPIHKLTDNRDRIPIVIPIQRRVLYSSRTANEGNEEIKETKDSMVVL